MACVLSLALPCTVSSYHSPSRQTGTETAEECVPQERVLSRFALGRQSMDAYKQVREGMQLPSWVSPAPRGFGTAEHGKLSADQWHTVCTIVLPVALIWVWGVSTEGRRFQMLTNFMDLVSAVVLAGLLETSDHHIELYREYMLRYLQQLQELFPEAPFKPNHHYALHIPDFMKLFAAVHSWRSFAFERYNYVLQRMNTNLTFGEIIGHSILRRVLISYSGELESTFMKTSCRAANLRPLLHDHNIGPAFSEFMKVFNKLSGEDERGLRLDAILRMDRPDYTPPLPQKSGRDVKLDRNHYLALLAFLNDEEPSQPYADRRSGPTEGAHRLPVTVRPMAKVFISGISYHANSSSSRDSNILFSPSSNSPRDASPSFFHAGSIQKIFEHSRTLPDGRVVSEVFLMVTQFTELAPDDQSRDPFRRFPIAGGRLVHEMASPDTIVIRPSQVICHVAKTPLSVSGIDQSCFHILPLDRVSKILRFYATTRANTLRKDAAIHEDTRTIR